MVTPAAILIAAMAGLADPAPVTDKASSELVRSTLAREGYPWYDKSSDSVGPVWPPFVGFVEWVERNFSWVGKMFSWLGKQFTWLGKLWIPGIGSVGRLTVIGIVILALTILLVVLLELWRRYRPATLTEGTAEGGRAKFGGMIKGLPEGIRPETDDPWAEALRCRERGDYARAIVCLFAHQLLTLDRLRHVRLSPGRTARQLVRSVDDRQFRGWTEATMRLFEAVYYGHRIPSLETFEATWAHAEAFERRVAAGPES